MIYSERVLVCAAPGQDAATAETLLAQAGIQVHRCAGLEEVCDELERGAGAVVVVEEACHGAQRLRLASWVEGQPSWSDFPFVVLTAGDDALEQGDELEQSWSALGNVSLLKRPLHRATLVSVTQTVLRGRRRQYETRAHLDALREGEQRLNAALTVGRLGTWEMDVATRDLSVSDHLKHIFGRGSDETLTYGEAIDSIHQDERARVEAAVAESLRTGVDYAEEFRLTLSAGMRWVEARARMLVDPRTGVPVSMVGICSDITARKTYEAESRRLFSKLVSEREKTKEALVGEKAFSSLLLTAVPAGIVAYDLEMKITTWNPEMQKFFGPSAEEALGQPLAAIFGDPALMSLQGGSQQDGAVNVNEVEVVNRVTGRKALCETQHAPMTGSDGTIVGSVAFFRDITERRHVEEQLRQAQKMETIGQLTGGVAHDFNNLLAAVVGNLELLRRKLPADTPLMRYIDGALQGASRGASLTQRLLAFARRQDLKLEAVDLARLIENMRGLLTRSLGPDNGLDITVAYGLPQAGIDHNQLELAILNLALNARDAMPPDGVVSIRLDRGEDVDPPVLPMGEYLRLTVSDTGTGMDEQTLKSAIEPFFSTKQLGKGTGLGLSMVHGLAVQLGGALRLSSTVGAGTSAELWVPVADKDTDRMTASFSRSTSPDKRHDANVPASRILVVDDDSLIAMSTVGMIEDLGHSVLEANSGQQALDILKSGEKVDALVTDYAMPGMTGVELAGHARKLFPALPILLATGYAELPAGTTTDLPRLKKPYRQQDLSEQLSILLNRPV